MSDERVVVTQPMCDPATFGLYALAFMQVCAVRDATDDEILTVCNRENHAGTQDGWTTVNRDTDEDEQPRVQGAVDCAEDAARIHLLVSC